MRMHLSALFARQSRLWAAEPDLGVSPDHVRLWLSFVSLLFPELFAHVNNFAVLLPQLSDDLILTLLWALR